MIKFMIKTNTPYEVLEDSSLNHMMHRRFEQIDSKYQRLMKKATRIGDNSSRVLFFQYAGELSISSDISNELSYRFPKKIIVVAYVSGLKVNISVRGKI